MTTSTAPDLQVLPQDRPGWPVVGLLLDAITRRDFDALGTCLEGGVRFRALVPPGLIELDSATDVVAKFTAWFGGDDDFEVLDASIGQTGNRLYARWKVRMTPRGAPENARVAEQHVFTRGEGRITDLDLMCSGFHAENGANA